jgi:hypothetical protein
MKKFYILLLTIAMHGFVAAQCPGTSPADFNVTDGGSPGCDAGTWKHEQGVTYTGSPSGDCLILTGTTCDLSWYTTRYSLDCNFCVSFSFSLSTLTSDGIAFSFVDLSNQPAAYPCSTPIGCAEGGNLGYNNLNNTNTAGTLTVEIDVFNNSGSGDDDPTCDHVSIVEDGNNNSSIAQACLPNMDDGASHTARICWNDDTNQLTVTIDGTTYITLNQDIENYFAQTAPSNVYFAVSSGYNGSFAGQNTICGLTVTGLLDANERNFNAKLNNSKIDLTWDNPDDLNAVYEIERSTDGSNFTTIANLQSLQGLTKYKYEDLNPQTGNNYYRLKERLIFNNTETTSSTKVVNFNQNSLFDINVFGNAVYVNVKSKAQKNYTLKIFDVSGKVVAHQDYFESSETQLKNLSNGMYIINLISDGENITKKVIISNE